MLFSSYIFLLVFLPITLIGFALLARFLGPKPAKLWLTLGSLFFYGWWNPVYVILIVLSMLFNFWIGRQIGRYAEVGRSGSLLLFLGVTANLLLLGYYKYANFFIDNINLLSGASWSLGQIVLPLGISFFTFTQIAYLVDVRRVEVCEYDLGDFLLFITFFPHLIAGPIIHHREMMPQFAEPKTYRFYWDNLAVGLGIFAIGLFKKVVIADDLSPHVMTVFSAAAAGKSLYSSDAWAGVLSYTFQIYFDFSGYSDMAIGLAKMFGIVLPQNFNSPYKSLNVMDFWRRWHMTLSRFLRDYLYIPMGGNRLGKVRRYVNLILTMVIGGFWHGAAWTFVIWGLFHGLCLAINHLWQEFRKANRMSLSLPSWLTRWTGTALTFILVAVGWVFFRAVDIKSATLILDAMFGLSMGPVAGTPALLKGKHWFTLAALLAFVWILPNATQLFREWQSYPAVMKDTWFSRFPWLRWQMSRAWAFGTALLLAAALLSLSSTGEFLYYNF